MISAKMEESQESGLDAEGEIDLELRMARFELLMDRRPLLLNRLGVKNYYLLFIHLFILSFELSLFHIIRAYIKG